MSNLQWEVNNCVSKTNDAFTREINNAYKVTQLNKRIQRPALLVTFPQKIARFETRGPIGGKKQCRHEFGNYYEDTALRYI